MAGCIFDLANVKYTKDLAQIRGKRIATVFQDPMTSLNPILTIGDQISPSSSSTRTARSGRQRFAPLS